MTILEHGPAPSVVRSPAATPGPAAMRPAAPVAPGVRPPATPVLPSGPPAAIRPRRLPRPRASRLLTSDVLVTAIAVTAVTAGLWVRHGGIAALLGGGAATLSAIGQLTGLLAALAALAGVMVAARPRLLERRYGLDRLLGWHRWLGITTVSLVLIHAVADTVAWASLSGVNPLVELIDMMRTQAWMVAAFAGTTLMVVVSLTSWRRIRRHMAYETWYFLHLTAYLSVILAFGHQITLGTDLVGDTAGLVWWIALAVVTAAVVLADRLVPLVRAFARAPLRVAAVTWEATGTGALHVTGPGLRSLRAAAGQFFLVRVMTPDLWWQAHPFSLSAAPTTAGLRFTVKELGDGSRQILRTRPGTRVVLEGPYGVFTADAARGQRVVLIGGGVGIAPLRAVLEDCTPDQRPVVILRARHPGEVAHRAELEALVAARNGVLHVLAGPRAWFAGGDPFRPEVLRAEIPDIAHRHAYLCGPTSLERAAEKGLRSAGVPTAHIHRESFGA